VVCGGIRWCSSLMSISSLSHERVQRYGSSIHGKGRELYLR
jgi:hypothetical protein